MHIGTNPSHFPGKSIFGSFNVLPSWGENNDNPELKMSMLLIPNCNWTPPYEYLGELICNDAKLIRI